MKKIHILLASTALVAVARAHDGGNSTTIADALAKLDPTNDAHWTADGQPRIDALKSLTGDSTLNRAAIDAAKPGFNREAAGGENRPGTPPTGEPAPAAPQDEGDAIGAKLLADGWQPHPDNPEYSYRGSEVRPTAELAAEYAKPAAEQPASSTEQGGDGTQTTAEQISSQTGMGGAATARAPDPVEGEPRKTAVSEPSIGQPGENAVGIVQGVTEAGDNKLGTPDGPVQNPGRDFDLSGEVAARNAGSVLTPSQAPGESPNTPTISLGGAADPLVEAKAPGGAVVAEGGAAATFFEGAVAGGPFANAGITAGDGPSATQLNQMGRDFDGDPDAVEALEKRLEETSAKTEELRSQVDDLSNQLNTSLRTEAQLRREIEAARPKSGTMSTIQQFLRSQHQLTIDKAEAEANK